MNVFALLLMVIAVVIFAIEYAVVTNRRLVSLGLAFGFTALIVQFCATSHSITF
jgi:hypothetical protein